MNFEGFGFLRMMIVDESLGNKLNIWRNAWKLISNSNQE
jgi:hypothetical protein